MKNEIWKDIYFEDKGKIYDYKGLYQVSNLGRVKRLETYVKDVNKNRYQKIKEHFLKNSFSKADGYFVVNLHKNGLSKPPKTYFGVKSSHHTPINQYDKNGNFIKKWDLVKEASESLNISRSSIWAVCNNKRKSAGGFKWRYINE